MSDILIAGNIVEGVNSWSMQNNPEQGDGIYVRNFKNVITSNNLLGGIAGYGIRFRGQPGAENPNSQHLTVIGNRVEAAGSYAYSMSDGFIGASIFEGNAAVDSLGWGFSLESTSGGGASLTFSGNTVNGAVDYGFYFRNWGIMLASGNHAGGISGLSRGFYPQDIGSTAKITGNSTTATTPMVGGGSTQTAVQDFANSWNPRVQYGAAAPSAGTWRAGDVVYNTVPAAGGSVGWICTTAGTPGTWKTFGAIAA